MTSNSRKHSLYFVLPNLNMGGAERVSVTLMRYVKKDKFQITLIVLDSGEGALSDELPEDIKCICLDKKSVKGALLPLLDIFEITHQLFSSHLSAILI